MLPAFTRCRDLDQDTPIAGQLRSASVGDGKRRDQLVAVIHRLDRGADSGGHGAPIEHRLCQPTGGLRVPIRKRRAPHPQHQWMPGVLVMSRALPDSPTLMPNQTPLSGVGDKCDAVRPCGYRKSHPTRHKCMNGLPLGQDDRLLEATGRIVRRTIQIACRSRGRDGISSPATARLEAIRAGEAHAAECRSPDFRLALSAVPVPARGCGHLPSEFIRWLQS